MYKNRHKFMQHRADSFVSATLPFDERLTPEQNRENLVSAKKKLEGELLSFSKGSKRRKEIGRQLQAINAKIHGIRPSMKAKGVDQHFIDAAREILSIGQFNIVMSRAVALMKEVKEIASKEVADD